MKRSPLVSVQGSHLFPAAPKRGRLLSSPLHDAIDRARSSLLDRQEADGHWVGELQGDTILESEFILLMAFLGREDEPRLKNAARYLLGHQQADGGWANAIRQRGKKIPYLIVARGSRYRAPLAGHLLERDTGRVCDRLRREG